MGLNVSVITFVPSTTIKSADVNSTISALNTASAPTFVTVTATSEVDWGAGVGGSLSRLTWDGTNHANVYWAPQSGATALGHVFVTWSGSAQTNVFSIGGQFASALSWIDNSGNFTTGGFLLFGATVGSGQSELFYNSGTNATTLNVPLAGAAAKGVAFGTWDGAAVHQPFSIGGQFASALSWIDNAGNYNGPVSGGIPMTRNGVAVSVPLYTGASTGANPPTGSVWIKA